MSVHTPTIDPLVPRPIDLPTPLSVDGDLDTEIIGALDRAKIIAAPDDPADWPAWRERLTQWRDDACRRLGEVRYPSATAWASRCWTVALTWLWDERLFDHTSQCFTPERFLEELIADVGGIDGVVLWHAYPVVGLDDRNQFDFYRDVAGLGDLVTALRSHGLRTFVDYNPWDTGTRREPVADEIALRSLVADLGADGIFLDTMREGSAPFVAALAGLDPPPVLEGESRVPLERIADHQLSWAQWFADSTAPGVLAARWFARHHVLHHTRRWNRDHSDELQSAWMNGTGMLLWDAVFGSWVGWNGRDRATLRRMRRVQLAVAEVVLDGAWTPLVDCSIHALAAGLYTSRFEHGDITLWTAINRSDDHFVGRLLDVGDVEAVGGVDGVAWHDLCTGARLADPAATVTVPARSIGGVLAVAGSMPSPLQTMLSDLSRIQHVDDATFPARASVRVAASRSTATPPPDAIVLGPGEHEVEVRYRLRETGMYGEAPFVEEWKPLPPRLHAEVTGRHLVHIGAVAVAALEELDADGAPLTGFALDEARQYAATRRARLPTEHEWQLAGGDPRFRRAEPWVWNWTESEHDDGITRFAILKGGADFRADGSDWYFDGGRRDPSFSAKLLLPARALQRSPSVGFRLAWDLDNRNAVTAPPPARPPLADRWAPA